jgi:WD40 repeat protein
VAVLPDGRRALSGSFDLTLRLWDLETGESRALKGHTGAVASVAVLPDGRRALSAGSNWTVILWDLESADPIATFVGDAAITAIAVAGEDLFIAGSENGAIHILKLVQ